LKIIGVSNFHRDVRANGVEFLVLKTPARRFRKDRREQNAIGHFYQSVGKVFNAYADAIIDDNAAPLSKFHQASM